MFPKEEVKSVLETSLVNFLKCYDLFFFSYSFTLFLLHRLIFFRGIYTKKVSISRDLLSWSKKSIYYTNTDVKISEESTYQELDISGNEITYQNTTIK